MNISIWLWFLLALIGSVLISVGVQGVLIDCMVLAPWFVLLLRGVRRLEQRWRRRHSTDSSDAS
jgi:hypothetical protein